MVINVALPYQDLTIMEACLKAGVNYLDTANYEPKDEAHFEYSWQWAYHDRFKEAGLTAILGCGFDPGVSGIYTAYAAKHYFDEIPGKQGGRNIGEGYERDARLLQESGGYESRYDA